MVHKEGCACAGAGTVFRVWEVLPPEGEQNDITGDVRGGFQRGRGDTLSAGWLMARWGCLGSGTPGGLMSAPGGGPGPADSRPAPQVLSWELFIPPLSDREEKRPLGRTWLGILALSGRAGRGTLPLRRWEPSQRVALTVPGEDTAAGSPARVPVPPL